MSDRVVVLSKRPATIKSIQEVRFSCEKRTPISCREAPEFRHYFNTYGKNWTYTYDKKGIMYIEGAV